MAAGVLRTVPLAEELTASLISRAADQTRPEGDHGLFASNVSRRLLSET
ncbi:hypothetical protein ACGFZJ_11325 [Streptomyces sp. NPDC048253]